MVGACIGRLLYNIIFIQQGRCDIGWSFVFIFSLGDHLYFHFVNLKSASINFTLIRLIIILCNTLNEHNNLWTNTRLLAAHALPYMVFSCANSKHNKINRVLILHLVNLYYHTTLDRREIQTVAIYELTYISASQLTMYLIK